MEQYIIYLLPIALIQIGFQIWALIDLFKVERVTKLSKWIWAVIIVATNLLGPILYFLLGRDE